MPVKFEKKKAIGNKPVCYVHPQPGESGTDYFFYKAGNGTNSFAVVFLKKIVSSCLIEFAIMNF